MTNRDVVEGIRRVVPPGNIMETYYNSVWWGPLPKQPCCELAWEMVARIEASLGKEKVGVVALRRGDLDEDVALDLSIQYVAPDKRHWQLFYCLSYVLPVAYVDYYGGSPYRSRPGLEGLPMPLQKCASDVSALLESGGYKLLGHEDPLFLQAMPGYTVDQVREDGLRQRIDAVVGEILFYSSLSEDYEQFGFRF